MAHSEIATIPHQRNVTVSVQVQVDQHTERSTDDLLIEYAARTGASLTKLALAAREHL